MFFEVDIEVIERHYSIMGHRRASEPRGPGPELGPYIGPGRPRRGPNKGLIATLCRPYYYYYYL